MSKESDEWEHKSISHERIFEWRGEHESLAVKATIGFTKLGDPSQKKAEPTIAKMGFFYYRVDSKKVRPITFLFNGGPGSSSLWLHLNAFGPYRVSGLSLDDVSANKKGQLNLNADSLIQYSDLVFVDPIGTGFSEAKDDESAKKFYGENPDGKSIAKFIHQFLIDHNLWQQPLFLAGESYGGIRSIIACEQLTQSEGIFPTGLIMIAPLINGISIAEEHSNVIARCNSLISYAMTAWFHKKSVLNDLTKSASEAYEQAEKFIFQEVLPLILKQSIDQVEVSTKEKLCAYLGIAPDSYDEYGDAFGMEAFSRLLFAGERRYPGRLDSRYSLSFPVNYAPRYEDPSMSVLERVLAPKTQEYLRCNLGLDYCKGYQHINAGVSEHWSFSGITLSGGSRLASVLRHHETMAVFVCSGYYDLAVPTASVEYDLTHMQIPAGARTNIKHQVYPAGHMMYVEKNILSQLSKDIAEHFNWT